MKKVISIFTLFVGLLFASLTYAQEAGAYLRMPVVSLHAGNPDFSITEALYDCVIEKGIVSTHATYKISAWKNGRTTVPLMPHNVALVKTDLSKDVLLVENNGFYSLILPKEGEYKVTLDFITKIKKIENKNILEFKHSGAVVSRLNVLIPGHGLQVELEPALSFQAKEVSKNTQLTAFLGNAKEVKIKWPTQQQVVAAKPVFLSETNTVVSISSDVVRTSHLINYKIMQGRAGVFRIALPLSCNLLSVKGKNIQNWDITKKEDGQILEIILSEPANSEYALSLETEQTRVKDSESYVLNGITTLECKRQSGDIAVISKDNLKIQPAERQGLSQIDINEVIGSLSDENSQDISFAYRYLKQPFNLVLNIEKAAPEITARSNLFLHIDEELMKLGLLVNYDIQKIGVFSLEVELPGGFTLLDVEAEGIEDWTLTKKEGFDLLNVRLKNKAIGKYNLLVKMEKQIQNIFSGIDVPSVKVNNVKRETGYIGISSETNIRLITKNKKEISEVDINELIALPQGLHYAEPKLAYKYITCPYQLSLVVEEVEPRVTSEVFTFFSVGEGLLLVDSAITYDILYSGIDELTVAFPEDIQVLDIQGKDIKSKQEHVEEILEEGKKLKRKIWKIKLHSKVKGKYRLYCSYEKTLQDTSEVLNLPKIKVLDVTREEGFICLGVRTSLEIKPNSIIGATPIDTIELPEDKAKGIDIPLVLAFKYVRHPYHVSVNIQKHEDVSVLVAMIQSAKVTSVLTPEGQLIVHAFYEVKNRQKQYLDMVLPKDASIWSAFVNNEPVKISRTSEGHFLVPLEKFQNEDKLFPVEIIYAAEQSNLSVFGRLKMIQPRLDIPVSNVVWQLYLPEDYRYYGFGGNLKIVRKPLKIYSPGRQFVQNSSWKAGYQRTRDRKEKNRNLYDLDEQFSSNIASQVKRYSEFQQYEPYYNTQNLPQSHLKSVNNSKVLGALPIRIEIPKGGRLYTFQKLFSNNELLGMSAFYSRAVFRNLFIMGFMGLMIAAPVFVLKQRKPVPQP